MREYPVDMSTAQIRKMSRGQTVTMKPENFVGLSPDILYVLEETAKRIERARKQGRGVRICLNPEEDITTMTEGGKISLKKAFKKAGKEISKGAQATGKALTSKKAMDAYKEIGKIAIEQGIPVATTLASMAMGDPTGMSGAVVGNIAADKASAAYQRRVMKEEGAGLFKALHKAGASKYGITKKSVTKTAKKIGKQAIDIGADVAGEAITAYTGNPMAGEAFKTGAKRLGNAAIESKSGKDALRKMKKEAKNIGVEMVDDYIDKKLSGPEKEVAQKALAGKYPSAKDLIFDYGSSKIEQIDAENEPVKFTGFGIMKPRGKKGMRRGGMCGGGSFKDVNKRSKEMFTKKGWTGGAIMAPEPPSSVIQTGSPYASQNSAQMNNKLMLASPQLAAPIRGGSIYPAGGQYGSGFWGDFAKNQRDTWGGSFNPAG